MSKLNPNKWPIEDTIKIMVATDNHLGYNETDSIRSEDSFIAFEEILKLAVEEKVDFILLGGDLFHDNKPSRNTMYKTIELLRKYCYGDKPSSLKFLSNQHINFKNNFGRANYLDPNLNISTPIFSIHGNHDDPAGLGGYCALDLLSMSGHINYFGRANGVDDILIHPILLQKGTTKLSLYGLGNVRDERLLKTFKKNKVRAVRPSQSPEEWFNLMVVHQNRQPHTVNKTDYLPEDQLFPFIDLVIWGHEHDCLIEPQLNPNKGFYVMQPGSSVATSLSEGESIRKHVAILKIHGTKFHVDKIPLKSIRPFKFLDLILEEFPEMELKSEERTMEILKNEVKRAATQAKKEWLELNQDVDEVNCPLPLVRLRVELGLNMESISTMNFINKFNGIIANPKDPIRFKRKKLNLDILKRTKGINSLTQSLSQSSAIPTSKVEDLLIEILNDSEPAFLPCPHMTETLKYFVDKEEKNAIEDFIKTYQKKGLDRVINNITSDDKERILEKILLMTRENTHTFNINSQNNLDHLVLNNNKTVQDTTIAKRTRNSKIQKVVTSTSKQSGISDDEYTDETRSIPKRKSTKQSKSTQQEVINISNDIDNENQLTGTTTSYNFAVNDEELEDNPMLVIENNPKDTRNYPKSPNVRSTKSIDNNNECKNKIDNKVLDPWFYEPDPQALIGDNYIPPTEIGTEIGDNEDDIIDLDKRHQPLFDKKRNFQLQGSSRTIKNVESEYMLPRKEGKDIGASETESYLETQGIRTSEDEEI